MSVYRVTGNKRGNSFVAGFETDSNGMVSRTAPILHSYQGEEMGDAVRRMVRNGYQVEYLLRPAEPWDITENSSAPPPNPNNVEVRQRGVDSPED